MDTHSVADSVTHLSSQLPPGLFTSPFANSSKDENIPYLLACPISLKSFTALIMDYYVLTQNSMEVDVFNPRIRDYTDSLKWERLFPYTGSVRSYFRTGVEQ